MTLPDNLVQMPLKLNCGRNLEKFGEVDKRKPITLEAEFKGQFWWEFSGQNAESKNGAYEDSCGKEDSIRSWTRGHLCYVLTKHLTLP
jgi:hypothetical protein